MLQRWLVVIIGLPLLLAALLLCPDWVTVIVVCGIAAAAAYELLHTAGKKVPKCVYAFTILAAVARFTAMSSAFALAAFAMRAASSSAFAAAVASFSSR